MWIAPSKHTAVRLSPSLLSDDQVRNMIKRTGVFWNYPSGKVWAKAIGWKRETQGHRRGQLGAILVNPQTGERWHYGVDPLTFEVVLIGSAR